MAQIRYQTSFFCLRWASSNWNSKVYNSFRCTCIFHNKRETRALDHMLIIRASDLLSHTVMFIMKKLWALTFFQGGDVGYILYNDQPPQQQKLFGDATRSCGHTKGAVLVQLTAWNDINGTQSNIYGGWSVNVYCFFVPGVVVFDKQQGFWLVHSTPHFPPPKSQGQFSYPGSGISNGQNFICVTYPFERFQTIGTTPIHVTN